MAIYNNCANPYFDRDKLQTGLKFHKDRGFRNRLILKAIGCMTVLLICATVLFVTVPKFFRARTEVNASYVHIFRKVPTDYDSDTREPPSENTALPDIRTQFVPSFYSPTIRTRLPRDTAAASADGAHNYRPKYAFWGTKEEAESVRKSQAERMLSYMDLTADPCEDFYEYACGKWDEKHPIPEDKAGYDTFDMLRESLDVVLRDLLEENDTNDNSAISKAKTLYRSCIDEETLKQRGNRPLINLLKELGGWPLLDPEWNETAFNWIDLSAKLRLLNNDILILHWIGPDFQRSTRYIIQFDQTNLGLPTKDYFLQPSNNPYLEAYKKYLQRILELLGLSYDSAATEAQILIDFEIELAKITDSSEQRQNVSAMYQRMTLVQLERLISGIDWKRYLKTILEREIAPSEEVVIFAVNYFQALVKLLERTPPRTVANYCLWRFVKNRVNNLDDKFQDIKQDFFRVLFGREKAPPKWTSCIAHVNTNMGMAVGSMFVKKYFDESSKNDTLVMTQAIMTSFSALLDEIDWLDNGTRKMAKQKVDAMVLRIGYPDFILEDSHLEQIYENVSIVETEYFNNTLNLLKHVTKMDQNRLGTIVDKNEWSTPPATVNAYYSRNKNQIMFPAGILQPPFYHQHFPRSLNYGGIGVVIGHEITHGLDDKGRLFDAAGNLERWWREETIQSFRERAKCFIDQYNSYRVQEINMQLDGISTQGENIADNGGMKQAFRAYETWVEENGAEGETLPGLNATNLQLFFINFAQVWCGTSRPEASRNKLQTAVHSPGKFRVIGTLSNFREFSRVFNCSSSKSMNPVKKCSIW